MAATRRFHGPAVGSAPTQRVGVYTRGSMYLLLALGVVFTLLQIADAYAYGTAFGFTGLPAAMGLGLILASAALCATCISLLRRGVGHYIGGPAPPWWMFLAVGLSLAANVVLACMALPARSGDVLLFEGDWRGTCVFVATASVVLALSPLFRFRWLFLASVLATVVTAAIIVPGPPDEPLDTTIGLVIAGSVMTLISVPACAVSGRLGIWMLGVVHELERTRVAHAQLAVAEERLRFSRDLHDVFGRTLSAVAVKSELAAELSARARPGAGEEMLEVRQIAQDALREVRAVVAGYRKADLAAELAGARSVLRSAGIDTTLSGAEDQVPDFVQEPLAWVVREGTTNVVRHSEATWCSIQLAVSPGRVSVEIVNDGAHPPGEPGTGLAGLTERLAALGGELSTRADGGRFALVAVVPLVDPASPKPAPADPEWAGAAPGAGRGPSGVPVGVFAQPLTDTGDRR